MFGGFKYTQYIGIKIHKEENKHKNRGKIRYKSCLNRSEGC